jgi:hypothetical protein
MLSLHNLERIRKGVAFLCHRRRITFVLAIACALLLGASIWRLQVVQVGHASQKQDQSNQLFLDQLRRGLGSQIRLADAKSSPDQVHSAVESVDSFIAGRSGLAMSTETKERLTAIEHDTLSGNSPRLSITQLAEILTDTALERAATFTDQEIDYAARVLSYGRCESCDRVSLRANDMGSMSTADFAGLAKKSREQVRNNGEEVRNMLLPVVGEELTTRSRIFGEAVPAQFGSAVDEGVTPLQAVVLAYSVVTDDLLAGSQSDLQETISRLPRRGATKGNLAERAFGAYGRIYSMPAGLIFNRTTMGSFLTRLEERGKAK